MVHAHRPHDNIIETAKRLEAAIKLQQIASDTRLPAVMKKEAESALYWAGYTPGMFALGLNYVFGTKLQKAYTHTRSPIKKNALEIKIKKSPRKSTKKL